MVILPNLLLLAGVDLAEGTLSQLGQFVLARVHAGVVHSQTGVVGLELAGTHQLDPLHQRDLAFDALGQRHLLEIAVGVGLQHALVKLEKLSRTPPQDIFKENLIKNARGAHFDVVAMLG